MSVAEAQERISEAEFDDWRHWFAWRIEMAERARKNLPMHDTDDADDMTPEESETHMRALMAQLQQRRDGNGR